jgi:hypothetical protein
MVRVKMTYGNQIGIPKTGTRLMKQAFTATASIQQDTASPTQPKYVG